MFCKKCNKMMNITDYFKGVHYKCNNCYNEEIEWNEHCCTKPDYIATRYYEDDTEAQIGHDGYNIYRQCQNCGKKKGTALKKSDYPKDKTPTFNHALQQERNERVKEFKKITDGLHKRIQKNKSEAFWDDYSNYLKSDEWLEKRDIVLKRDNYKCQSCLKETATQVHHSNGLFRKNEPLFTLFSVCDKCHEIITQIERGYTEAEKIKYK